MKLIPHFQNDQFLRLKCEGDVTMAKMLGKPDPLLELLGSGGFTGCVLLDLEKAPFVDSHGIGWLIRAHKHFLDAGGVLVLHSVPPKVVQTLAFLKLDKVFHLAADEEAARRLALTLKEAKP